MCVVVVNAWFQSCQIDDLSNRNKETLDAKQSNPTAPYWKRGQWRYVEENRRSFVRRATWRVALFSEVRGEIQRKIQREDVI